MVGIVRPILVTSCLSLVLLVSNVSADTIEAFTEPYREVELAAGDSGIIAEMLAKVGDSVNEGQLLVSLDNRVLIATLAVAEQKARSSSSVDMSVAELELRKERLAQVTMLRQRGHATQRELSRAQTDLAVADARVRQAKDELALSQLDCKRVQAQISQREIVSPFSGIVTELHRKIGEPTLVTDPRIVTLAQLDQLRAKFSATPSQVAQLRPNQVVSLKLAETNQQVSGTIERISKTIDAKSGTIELHVVINNADDRLRSGARCLLDVTGDHTGSKATLAAFKAAKSNKLNTETVGAALFGNIAE